MIYNRPFICYKCTAMTGNYYINATWKYVAVYLWHWMGKEIRTNKNMSNSFFSATLLFAFILLQIIPMLNLWNSQIEIHNFDVNETLRCQPIRGVYMKSSQVSFDGGLSGIGFGAGLPKIATITNSNVVPSINSFILTLFR